MDRQKAVKQQGQKRNLYLHAKNTSTLSYVKGGREKGKKNPRPDRRDEAYPEIKSDKQKQKQR